MAAHPNATASPLHLCQAFKACAKNDTILFDEQHRITSSLAVAERKAWKEITERVKICRRVQVKMLSDRIKAAEVREVSAAKAADGPDADGPDPDGPPLKKAKKPPPPIPRTRLDRRPNESEEERQVRVRAESGSRRQRDKAQRAFDQQKRRALQRTPTMPAPNWRESPPLRPPDREETTAEKARRVDGYFERLTELSNSFHTCPNCWERDCDHVHLGETELCKYCCDADRALSNNGRKFGQENGLQLKVELDAQTPAEDRGWMTEWTQLREQFGELRPLEEALVSPVLCMSSVLQLPSGQQLGYRGSVINFVSEIGTVAHQLPRAMDSGMAEHLVVYRVRGKSGTHKDVSVRKAALYAYLKFFGTHHRFFKEGIPDPHRAGEYIVPPFRWNPPAEGQLPAWFNPDFAPNDANPDEDSVPDGLNYRDMADEEAADELPRADERAERDGDGPRTPASHLVKVNTQTLLRFLQQSDGKVATAARIKLFSKLRLDIERPDDADAILNVMHGLEPTNTTECRHDGIAIVDLADNVAILMEHPAAAPDLVRDELVVFVESLGIELTESSCPHTSAPAMPASNPLDAAQQVLAAKLDGAEDQDIFEGEPNHQVGTGTLEDPLPLPRRSKLPLSEFKSKGYMTLAFPTLFPKGRGHFEEPRDRPLKWEEWCQHLMHFYDGRFACHRRFPHFLLNTHERQVAVNKVGIFVKRDATAGRLTYGQLRALGRQEREAVFRRLSAYGQSLRNTPEFFKQRRHELQAMVEQLGDPHVFATNSHADTHCPYLHRFIKSGAQIPDGDERDPFAAGLTSSQCYKRRLANIVAYPHLTAQFFHLKTELFFEHIGESLGCEAHWCRYEWQSRGSTHAHYFLWLKDAPDVSFLDEWVQNEVHALGDGAKLTEMVVEQIVNNLNARALAASDWTPPGGWEAWPHADGLVDALDGSPFQAELETHGVVPDVVRAAHAAQWWASRCGRWNHGWDDEEKQPHAVGERHPSSEEHAVCPPCASPDDSAPWLEQRRRLLNKNNRHTTHYPSYCLRRDAHGKLFCRFGFPHEPRSRNVPHFYFELVRNKDGSPKGVRAQLYLPMNDPLMNTTNAEQAASQRANVDFKPLIDHFSALEYATKYATKQERGSKAFDKMIALALNGGGRAEPEKQNNPAVGAFASFLVQQTGGRDWSAQEVAHVNMGLPTVIASHEFIEYSVTGVSKLKSKLQEDAADDEVADQANRLDQYFNRLRADNMSTAPGGVQTSLLHHGVTSATTSGPVDREEVAACSFSEFWRQYQFITGGRSKGHQIVRRTAPTIVSIKPHLPKSWNKRGHEKRSEYCRLMLLKHRPFAHEAEYKEYGYSEHGGDWEAAYQAFATMDPRAPEVCRDDFRAVAFFEEGDEEEEDGSEKATVHEDFDAYRVNPAFEQAAEQIRGQEYDWVSRSAARYTQQEITDSAQWQARASQEDSVVEPPAEVDLAALNEGQRRVFDTVTAHAAKQKQEVTQPLLAMVCGTAGSGKTFLIRAIKQQLGEACLVLAPTGVAADNIGGRTYHSVLPMPRSRKGAQGNEGLDRPDIAPKSKARIEKLVTALTGVTHIIMDEMSMVGRRSLGQIDHLLRFARGNHSTRFGGLNVILVGVRGSPRTRRQHLARLTPTHPPLSQDHGQLSPVQDCACFDITGVQYGPNAKQNLRGKAIPGAPKWQQEGVKAYQEFRDVFFLDRIERVSQSSDEAEAAILERFRALQLRCRDGELTEEDYAFMKEHMMIDGRQAEFSGPDTYNLVTTRAARDEKNNVEFMAALKRGVPSITIEAINSGKTAAAADDQAMEGLTNELHLCLGARVMIIKNLCTAHGLCNGTIGHVHDIIVNEKGFVTAVVLRVRRATAERDGYKGPAFREGGNGVDASEVLIAVNRRRASIWAGGTEGKEEHRDQFPLKLAWSLTIHKSQGLTLPRVVIDAAETEKSVGLLFVAMTRVRHPKHIAFDPWPGLERVTSEIAGKPSLKKRKMHEVELRALAAKTASRYGHAPPPPPAKPPPPPVGRALPGLGGYLLPKGSASPHTGQAAASRPKSVKPSPEGTLALPRIGQTKRKAASENPPAAKQPLQRQSTTWMDALDLEFKRNTDAVTSLGLPPLTVPASRSAPCPALAAARAAGLVLEARVIDFWSLSQPTRAAIGTWLRDLGFAVTMTTDRTQLPLACGYIAARATGAMFAAANCWRTVDVSDAVGGEWVDRGNKVLEKPGAAAHMLETQDVYTLVQRFHEHKSGLAPVTLNDPNQAWPCQAWPLTVGARDWFACKLASTVMDYAAGGWQQAPKRAFYVTNTQDCRGRGAHWISVAIGLRWASPPSL